MRSDGSGVSSVATVNVRSFAIGAFLGEIGPAFWRGEGRALAFGDGREPNRGEGRELVCGDDGAPARGDKNF